MGLEPSKETWEYSLLEITQDKHAARPGTPIGMAFQLTGADGSLEGGLRPFPGFKQVHEIDWEKLNLTLTAVGDPAYYHTSASKIVDLIPFNTIVGDDGYAYGFVYRIKKGPFSGPLCCDIFVDYYNSKLGYWSLANLVREKVPLPPELDSVNGRRMSVSTFGRYGYVFVQGMEPYAFTTDRDTPWAFSLVSDTGPGLMPELIEPLKAGDLGSIVALDAGRDGNGQLFLTQSSPDEVGMWGGTGPTDEQDEDAVQLVPGDYAFAYQLVNSQNGRRSALSKIAPAREAAFYNPVTDSVFKMYAALEITYNSTKYDQAYIYRSVETDEAGGTYVSGILHLEAIIDLADYLTVNNPLTPSTVKQAVYFYTLEDEELVYQETFLDRNVFDEDMPKGGTSLWYDTTMLVSSIRDTTAVSSTEQNRKGDLYTGLGELRWSSTYDIMPELFSPFNRYIPAITTNEIIGLKRVGDNVIGWSVDRQYHIRKQGGELDVIEMHEGFGTLTNKTSETVGSMAYFLTWKGVKSVSGRGELQDVQSVNELIMNTWAADLPVCSMAYDPTLSVLFMLNPEREAMALFWFNTAKVTELVDTPFTVCARGVWPEGFTWTNLTGGTPGSANTGYARPLSERVFFAEAPPGNSDADPVTGYKLRIHQVDYLRERTQTAGLSSGVARRTLLPFSGDSIWAVSATVGTGSSTISVTTTGKSLSADVAGCELYVIDAADKTLIGKSCRIRYRPTSSSLSIRSGEIAEMLGGVLSTQTLVAGDTVGISPVYWEFQGHPAPGRDEATGRLTRMEAFQTRHFDSIGCSFTDVTNERSAQGTASFVGVCYRGSSTEPAAYALTLGNDDVLYGSLVEYEALMYGAFDSRSTDYDGRFGVDGTILSPGVRMFFPDIDYRVISVLVTGELRASRRARRI